MLKRYEAEAGTGRWTAADARAVLAMWAESGLTKTAFAEQQGLKTERLRRWGKRLAERGGDAAELRLVPLVPREASRRTEEASAKLQLPGGVVLELDTAQVDPRWVAALVLDVARAR
jgi:transposase-like protein